MKKIYAVIFSLIALSCSSCGSVHDRPSKYEKELYKKIIASDGIKNCKKNGGEVQKAGIMQMPHCVITYPDAGKPCKNSSECTNSCLLIEKSIPMGELAEGECQHNSLSFGCYAPVENGIAGAAICVD